ncbi:MAG: hypothetical protein NVS2B16_32360 [Chloroflexota bacterium]
MDIEGVLHNISLFAELDPKQLKTLVKFTRTRSYQPGEVLVTEGKPGFGLYIIEEGTVEVTQHASSGERVIGSLESGKWFGELALLDDHPRASTVIATTPVRAIVLDKVQFWVELRNHPEVSLAVLRRLAQMLRGADATLAQIA